MAITLDELLHKNTKTAESESFPSYEDFRASRGESAQARYDYDLDAATETIKNFRRDRIVRDDPYYTRATEERAPYDAPQRPYFDDRSASERYADVRTESRDGYGVAPYRTSDRVSDGAYADDRRESVYDFTARDPEAKSASELMGRLEYSSSAQDAYTPALGEDDYAEQAKARKASEEKSAKRLNARGKLIIVLYAIVAVVVATLIGVNAKKINSGEAVAPTSSVQIEATLER